MITNLKNPTSQDVAKLAGVSQSAVSRCFTKGSSISNRMRLRVIEAAKQLGYKPDIYNANSISNDITDNLVKRFTCQLILRGCTRNVEEFNYKCSHQR